MAADVAIVEIGANLNSLIFALERLGCAGQLTTNPDEIRSAERVILPGVGSAAAAMQRLEQLELTTVLTELRQPVLGICLGMQLLFARSTETSATDEGEVGNGTVDCLGIFDATIDALAPMTGLSVPHMGWNENTIPDGKRYHPLLDSQPSPFITYFVHGYRAPVGPWTLATCQHGETFSSVVGQGNYVGTQFHPERSGPAGAQLLSSFCRWDGRSESP